MGEINFKEAKFFLEGINKNDDVVIIHHDDLDGFASGMLFFDFCEKKAGSVKNIVFSNGGDQQNVLKQTKKGNKFIICDLGPSAIPQILDGLKNKNVFYTDHHQKFDDIPSEILELRTTKDGYIPSSRTAYELVGGKLWMAIAGTISDMGHFHPENRKFLDSFLKPNKISQKRYLEDIVFTINKFITYFSKKPIRAFSMLKKLKGYKEVKTLKKYARPVEKEMQKYIKAYKKNREMLGIVSYYTFSPKYNIKSNVCSQVAFLNREDLIVFAVQKDKNWIGLSGRSQNKDANMIEVLQTGIKGLKNANAGGHIPAAGGQIKAKDLDKFKKNLKNYRL